MKSLLKRSFFVPIILILATVISNMGIFASAESAAPTIERAECAYLYNIENDAVLFEKNGQKSVAPASTVKIMTAILALEYYKDDLDVTVTVPHEALRSVQGNNIGLDPGEQLTARDLIAALVIGGANDAAQALACLVAGSEAAFCDMMNAKAEEIGAVNTHYTNASGLDDRDMKTTAEDTAKIAAYAYNVSGYIETASLTNYEIAETNSSKTRTIYTKNYLLSGRMVPGYYYSRANGMNAGSTYGAGYCIAASAANEGLTYICIIFGAEKDSEEDGGTIWSFKNAAALLDWAFEGFGYLKLVDTAEMVCEIEVKFGAGVDHVALLPKEKLELFMPLDIDMSKDIVKTWYTDAETVEAPVFEGEKLGRLTLSYNGEIIGEVDLIAKNSVNVSRWQKIAAALENFFTSGLFKTIVISLVIAAIIYVFLASYFSGKRKKQGKGQ